ncbi:probable receptor-like protein kinase At1g49730 isoform X1 [Zingiber officinale]|uniref:probable receptor-like protein kinase At1g49730 isoform X1 n=1 Tax=Zingiber officinale TaxID=94328 RepID=UPI001C4BD981|nr:probable receptor-like protein kinase At1g49730 isoform X1 [Zingiber officinale]
MEHRLLRRMMALILRWRRLSRSGIPFVKSFTYKQINKATSGFGVILESGPQGTIYKAQFPNGLVGAVRRVRSHQLQNNSFLKNVQLLGRLHHRHLVKLKGFCEGKDRFLVFDYMENGRLKDYLHDPLKTPLDWRTRLQIAIDIAAALEYLQYFCEPPIYNVSISSNNIFLDENFVAKLSDVGFVDCDLICNGESNITCSEDNTEQRNRRLVFQFGMLLLELITGQSLLNEAEIVHWIQESGFAYSIHKMVDTDLGDSYDSKELGNLLVVARLCTKAENDTSISIPQILRFLQGHTGHSTL